MATHDPTSPNPSSNLIEVADLLVTDQPDLNAVRVEVVDPAGAGVAFLLGPPQVSDFIIKLIGALAGLRGWTPGAGPLSGRL